MVAMIRSPNLSPAATAGCFARRLWSMMALAVVCCWAFVGSGLVGSYCLDLPSGPVIVVIAVVCYVAALLVQGLRGRRSR